MERVRRVRAAPPEEIEEVEEVDEAAEDAASPDAPLEGETAAEAEARIMEKYKKRARSPLKAIRAFCVTCMGGQVREIARCTAMKTCVLYPFRMGRNPFQSGSNRTKKK